MAQININTGTPGDANTGDTVNAAFQSVESNFTDLYTNYLPKSGGTITGTLGFTGTGISHIETIEFWNKLAANEEMHIDMATDDVFSFTPVGNTNDLTYTFSTDKWSINGSDIITVATADGDDIPFDSYLTITSTDVQAAIEELKDELDAAVLSAGSGDMLKSVYDIGNSGVVDNSEALGGQSSAYHLDRTNHTGTQTASTISDFDTEVSNNADVVANTAKETNATHTGDVTGATALTIDPTAISGKTSVTPVSGDFVLLWDATDSLLKKTDVASFLSGGGLDATIQDGSTNAVQNNAIHDALADINSWVDLNNIEANKIIDGAGSGLDADLLDGQQGASYLRSDVADSKTAGDLTFNDNVKLRLGTGADMQLYHSGTLNIANFPTGGVFAFQDNGVNSVLIDVDAGDIVAGGVLQGDSVNFTGGTLSQSGSDAVVSSSSANLLFKRLGVTKATIGSSTTTLANTIQITGLGGSGTGIVAVDNTGNLSHLDHHEGSFTPTLIGATSGSYTFVTQVAEYVKIGRVVHFNVILSSINGTTPAGELRLGGLPYSSGWSNSVSGSAVGMSVNHYHLMPKVFGNYIRFDARISNTVTTSGLANVDFTAGTLEVTGTFMTA